MRLFVIPSSVARHLMMGTAVGVVGLTAWVTYEKAVNRNPMRMRKDAEGVWHWMTYEEHLADKLADAQAKLAGSPDSQTYKFMVAVSLCARAASGGARHWRWDACVGETGGAGESGGRV